MSHHHHHDTDTGMPFAEKLEKILEHWLKHNEDHAANYRSWARQARDHGLDKAAEELDAAANMTLEINGKFQEAREHAK